jgi:acid phosphatase type 7
MQNNTSFNTGPRSSRPGCPWFTTSLRIASLLLIALSVSAAPRHVYLTWQGDTSRTITVNYQTLKPTDTSAVYFDTQSRKDRPGEYRYKAVGTSHQIPGLADERKIHWVELGSLAPGETYYFIAGDPQHGFTAEQKFRTIPAGSQKLRFVTGGDMGVSADVAALLQQAAKLDPAFGVVGGDIAYAGDLLANYHKWDAWLDLWETNMVAPTGCTIPMVLAIGNHEVHDGPALSRANAQFYFQYFAQDRERSYYSRTFGKNLAMFLLDSEHISPDDGEQAGWLNAQLSAHDGVPCKIAVYHVPLYPCYRAFDGGGSVKGRQTWLPIFDQHHLTAAFENHDHAFKRTLLLRENKPDPQGTLYLGDGCWGMSARKVGAELRWYEAKAASLQHFWCVDVSPNRVEYRALNKQGQVFDVYPPDAAGAKAAEEVYESLRQPKLQEKSAPPSPNLPRGRND